MYRFFGTLLHAFDWCLQPLGDRLIEQKCENNRQIKCIRINDAAPQAIFVYSIPHSSSLSLSRGCRFMRMVLSIYIDLVKDLLIRLNRCQKQLFAIFFAVSHIPHTHMHVCRHLACAIGGARWLRHDIIILTMSLLNPFDFTHSFHFIIFPFIGISNQEQENAASTRMAHTHTAVGGAAGAAAREHTFIYNKFIHTWIHNKFNWFNT